jgi:hypothetical protein
MSGPALAPIYQVKRQRKEIYPVAWGTSQEEAD